MDQAIIGYHQDEINDWVAELQCGHYQHIRHKPPWINREWVINEVGRNSKLGEYLFCKKCQEGVPKDNIIN